MFNQRISWTLLCASCVVSGIIITGCQFTLGSDDQIDLISMTKPDSSLDDNAHHNTIVITDDLGVTTANSRDERSVNVSTDDGFHDQRSPIEDSLAYALDLPSRRCLGPWMCRDGQGCVEGQCGSCRQTKDCSRGDVCHEDTLTCGECNEQNPCDTTQSCIEGICLPRSVFALSLELDDTDWLDLSEMRYLDHYWVDCTLASGSITEPNSTSSLTEERSRCQVRVHGGSSRDFRKLSLRIKLEDGSDELAWGDQHIVLRAEYNDPTMMRNVLSHLLFERTTSLPQSRWRYVWLTVNGQTQGLYVQVERHRESMLNRWGRSDTAPRYESDPPLGSASSGSGSLVTLDSRDEYWDSYELKGGASYSPLITLIEDDLGMMSQQDWLNLDRAQRLAKHLDWGEYLRYLAVMTRIQNLDHIRKNFIITRQLGTRQEPRWELHPWDLDLSWGCLYNDNTGLTLCDGVRWDIPLSLGFLPDGELPNYPTDGLYNMLASRALSPEQARRQYTRLVCDLSRSDQNLPPLKRINDWRKALATWLPPWVSATPQHAFEIGGQYQDHVANLETFWQNRGQFIRDSLACEP